MWSSINRNKNFINIIIVFVFLIFLLIVSSISIRNKGIEYNDSTTLYAGVSKIINENLEDYYFQVSKNDINTARSSIDDTESEYSNINKSEEIDEDIQLQEPQNFNIYNLSNSEILLIKAVVFSEAGAQTDLCQQYTCSVILNRLISDKFPNNITDIIYQENQYGCSTNGYVDKYLSIFSKGLSTEYMSQYDYNSYTRCFNNVDYILNNGSILDSNFIYQCDHKEGKHECIIEDGVYFSY